jgi:crotonobetainyl-CoA:carnitine CoA-transferase CaiB-like acyl-CoA transferase
MELPMRGVRVLEVAQFTFVPAAAAVLSDWGAEVIKVEHPESGDAQRGLARVMGFDVTGTDSSFSPLMEGPNRGKRSIGLALDKPEARPVLEKLVRNADVFITNFLPSARQKLQINVEDIRRIKPDIIYVRGSAFGAKGHEREKGGYDSTAFWARGGSAASVTPPDSEVMLGMPAGAYGDSISGLALAGGIAAALFGRATKGEPSVVDASLHGVGTWAMQLSVNLAMATGGPLPVAPARKHGTAGNPLMGAYRTADGRWLMLAMLQAARYWGPWCDVAGRPDLAADARFASAKSLMDNTDAAAEAVAEIVAARTYQEWIQALDGFDGQWSVVQNAWEAGQDAGARENGFIAEVVDAEGVRRELVASPIQFDEQPASLRRAPQFAEHTDDILRELGYFEEDLIDLKIAGAVT